MVGLKILEKCKDEIIKKRNDEFYFILLRDTSGKIQLQFNPKHHPSLKDVPVESVIEIQGIIQERPENMKNKKMKNGDFEVMVSSMEILNQAPSPLPLQWKNSEEEVRLRYRYLDLRREELQNNLKQRSKMIQKMRNYLLEHQFLEVETPSTLEYSNLFLALFKSTPEGSREFVVPTRQKGKFYSLVQSPQQYKQLLMIGGVDRYFQVARCYRDEGGRSDRQPEFTQLDIEMSFIQREDIIHLIQEMMKKVFEDESIEFPTLSYDDCMSWYGSDKPDLVRRNDLKKKRIKEKIQDLSDFTFPFEKKKFTFGFIGRIGKNNGGEMDIGMKIMKFKHLDSTLKETFHTMKEDQVLFLMTGEDRNKVRRKNIHSFRY
jgi:aspartyl-tRNA synthetase